MSTHNNIKSFKSFYYRQYTTDSKDVFLSDQDKLMISKSWLKHFNSIQEKDLYDAIYSFCDIAYWMGDELNMVSDHKRISKELIEQKKETSNAYKLMFFVFILGCILGEIRGRFF